MFLKGVIDEPIKPQCVEQDVGELDPHPQFSTVSAQGCHVLEEHTFRFREGDSLADGGGRPAKCADGNPRESQRVNQQPGVPAVQAICRTENTADKTCNEKLEESVFVYYLGRRSPVSEAPIGKRVNEKRLSNRKE